MSTNDPKIEYNLEADGEASFITRRDPAHGTGQPERIAKLDGKRVTWLAASAAKYRALVTRFLKAGGIEPEFEEKPEPVEAAPEVPREPRVLTPKWLGGATVDMSGPGAGTPIADDGPDGMRGLSVEVRKAVNHLRAKEGFPLGEVEPNPPPMPAQSSGAGDKTPAVVRWYLRYFPKLFAEKYGVLGLGSIEAHRMVMDKETRRLKRERFMEPGHVIARRETIFTRVKRSGDAAGEGGEA